MKSRTSSFLESQRTMELVLRHLSDFPLRSHELHVGNQAFLFKILVLVGFTAMLQIAFGIYTSHKLAGPVVKMSQVLDMRSESPSFERS